VLSVYLKTKAPSSPRALYPLYREREREREIERKGGQRESCGAEGGEVVSEDLRIHRYIYRKTLSNIIKKE
jgi:hypothetical protein